MNPVIERLKLFKGSLLSSKWKVPKSGRQFCASLNRLIKLFYAMQDRHLYYPELVDSIQTLAHYYKIYIIKNRPDKGLYLEELDKIIEFEAPAHFVRIEQMRIKENKKCSVCRVSLVYPAYLIYTDEKNQELRSEPTGIFCLRQLHGYLNDLRDSLKVEWEIEEFKKDVETRGREFFYSKKEFAGSVEVLAKI